MHTYTHDTHTRHTHTHTCTRTHTRHTHMHIHMHTHTHTHTHTQFNRPLTLCKDTIQTRNRKSTGKKSKKSKSSKSSSTVSSTVASLLPPSQPLTSVITHPHLQSSSTAVDSMFPPVPYVITAPSGPYPSPDAPRSVFSQEGATVYGGSYTSSYPAPSFPATSVYDCGRYASHQEDIKPNISATTSAFALPHSSCYSSVNSSTPVTAVSVDSGIENGMTNGNFHSSQYSAFSPFPSDHSSPMQPTTPQNHSPLL